MVMSKTRKWGNSLVVLIPKDEARKLNLKENEEVSLEIKQSRNVLRELFGFAKGKINKSTEQIIKEARKDTSKYF